MGGAAVIEGTGEGNGIWGIGDIGGIGGGIIIDGDGDTMGEGTGDEKGDMGDIMDALGDANKVTLADITGEDGME